MSDDNEVKPQNDPMYSPNTEPTGQGIPATDSSAPIGSATPTTGSEGPIGGFSSTGSDLSDY